MDFHEKSEKAGQVLIFNPAKVARARERAAAQKEIGIQRKQNTADKKLQQAITREDKAQQAAKKKKEMQLRAQRRAQR